MTVLLRTAEVSDQTGIPVATLRWWRHRGEGPQSFKLGKKTVVYPADALAVWIGNHSAG
jgi:prophage regulatory protein